MKPEQMTEALEAAAKQLGVRVRYEALAAVTAAGSGGLCRVKGEWSVIIDRKTSASERATMLAEALAAFDTDQLFLPPKVREMVQHHRAARTGKPNL
jgi:hypothetical protein